MLMNKSFKVLCLASFIVCLIVEAAYAGAWTREKCGWYHQVTGNYYKANELFDDDGSREDFADNGEFTDQNISYYVEYGILDSLTLIGSWPYKWLEFEDDTILNKTDGFSDLELGLKYRLFASDSGVFAVQGLVKIPEAYDEDDAVPLGNAQYDYELRLLYGLSLFPHVPGYVNIETGYRFRAEAPADEVKYLLELGVDITQKVYSRMKLDGTLGMDNADHNQGFSGNPAATYDYDLGKLDVALGYKIIENWGMEIGYRPEIYGENTSAGTNWSLSVIYQMK